MRHETETCIHAEFSGRTQPARAQTPAGAEPEGDVGHRVPRVAKLMALAIRFEGLIRDGVVADYAELARSWARLAGQDHANHQFAQLGTGHRRGDFVSAGRGTGKGSDHRTGSAADCGGRGLEKTAADVATSGGAFGNRMKPNSINGFGSRLASTLGARPVRPDSTPATVLSVDHFVSRIPTDVPARESAFFVR